MTSSPATRPDIDALLGEIDGSYIERVLDTGASADEIAEAIALLDATPEEAGGNPSQRALQVRAILTELVDVWPTTPTVPVPAIPTGHPW